MTFRILEILVAVLYWGGMAGIILFDAKTQRERARAAGTVDFADRSPMAYLLLGLICGPIPLMMYFGTTRKALGGWLTGAAIGIGWTLFCLLLARTLLFLPP